MKDFKKSHSFGKRDFGGRPSFGNHGSDRAESFDATCASCNAHCEVPFKPNGKKPVYCRNCFKQNVPTTTAFSGQPFTRPTEYKEDGSTTDLKKQFAILNTKLDRLISAIEAQTRVLAGTQD